MVKRGNVSGSIERLEDLPNVGPATTRDLHLLGIDTPADLIGKDPLDLYERLCEVTGKRQDPCVLDVFLAVTHFMRTGKKRPWWSFTKERKELEITHSADDSG